MVAIIRQFDDGMQACARLDNGECSNMSDVRQGIRQRRVLAPLLFNFFFTAVVRVAEKRFLSDAVSTDTMVLPQRKKEKGEKKGTPRAGIVDGSGRKGQELQRLWSML